MLQHALERDSNMMHGCQCCATTADPYHVYAQCSVSNNHPCVYHVPINTPLQIVKPCAFFGPLGLQMARERREQWGTILRVRKKHF